MPDVFDATGLTVATYSELLSDLSTAWGAAYGAGVNLNPNSPDGQIVGIMAQFGVDLRELLVSINSSFSIQSAQGVVLDSRMELVGVQRKAGTQTLCQVSVTATAAATLVGQDQLLTNPNAVVFTVEDAAGNQYQLVTTYVFSAAGTQTLTFQCTQIGQVQTIANTTNIIVTAVAGISSVNNPSVSSDTIGIPEETDAQLKVRAAASYFLQAVGPADAVRAALLAYADVSDAMVWENDTAAVVNGIPANGIYVVVNGGTAAEIGQAIYSKKSAGCAMGGALSVAVTRPQGPAFTAYWDAAVGVPLYIQATLYPRQAGQVFNLTADAAALAAALIYKLGQSAYAGDIVNAMASIEPGAILASVQVSLDGSTWEQVVTPAALKNYFLVSAANITLVNA